MEVRQRNTDSNSPRLNNLVVVLTFRLLRDVRYLFTHDNIMYWFYFNKNPYIYVCNFSQPKSWKWAEEISPEHLGASCKGSWLRSRFKSTITQIYHKISTIDDSSDLHPILCCAGEFERNNWGDYQGGKCKLGKVNTERTTLYKVTMFLCWCQEYLYLFIICS